MFERVSRTSVDTLPKCVAAVGGRANFGNFSLEESNLSSVEVEQGHQIADGRAVDWNIRVVSSGDWVGKLSRLR